jgi:hypothetical protein
MPCGSDSNRGSSPINTGVLFARIAADKRSENEFEVAETCGIFLDYAFELQAMPFEPLSIDRAN